MSNEKSDDNQGLSINLNDDEEEDSSTVIEITVLSGKTYDIDYLQLFKFSKLIKDKYPFDRSVNEQISALFQTFQKNYEIDENNIYQFFLLVAEKSINLNIDNMFDLWKISILFKVPKLKSLIMKFKKIHENDVEFLIKLWIEEESKEINDLLDLNNISINVESDLKDKIEECLNCENFGKLSVSKIFQLISSSDKKSYTSDSLYKFIKESIEERHVLFQFIDIQSLSDENFTELAQILRNNNFQSYKDYLRNDFEFINSLKQDKTELQRRIEYLLSEKQQLDSQVSELINLNDDLKNQITKEKEKSQLERDQIQTEKEQITNEKDVIEEELRIKKDDSLEKNRKIDIVLRNIHLKKIGEYNEEGIFIYNISKYSFTCCL